MSILSVLSLLLTMATLMTMIVMATMMTVLTIKPLTLSWKKDGDDPEEAIQSNCQTAYLDFIWMHNAGSIPLESKPSMHELITHALTRVGIEQLGQLKINRRFRRM